ncbi:hypothetical protein ACVIW2_007026 [Bradyrhizobium huanghuaihaiense]|uniref:Uncharacterized protein n=1 Tax=Bradyrhizobium huanghuaihaiense TaxID=990078 RepID=A0A562QUG2_9BRAD|nr:hypothetical protein [Bradyrhizobium huanghuaihaiense]TWI60478.1 hypothetical protein IQ16_07598 [Bradyrhizobium huanghuaihaiense]
MLTDAKIDSALKKLADSFLNEQRAVDGRSDFKGWGQFIGQANRNQVGLYGTCAGVICISLAYGHPRIPTQVADYLASLWNDRNVPGTRGARDFALTARRAFFLMAVRQSKHPQLQALAPEADRELRERILSDGLLVSWQIDKSTKAATGNETATCVAILAYALTGNKGDIPPEMQRAAAILQERLEGAPSSNSGLRKFSLCSLCLALDGLNLRPRIKQWIARSKITPDTRGQDTLDFWDYDFRVGEGLVSRRDYLHVPADAVDILLASGLSGDKGQHHAAVNLADEAADSLIDSGFYFGGRERATSLSQAWIALALEHSRALIAAKTDSKPWYRFSLWRGS